MKVKIGVTVVCMMIVSASLFAGFTGTDVFLPSVGAAPGVAPAVWYTTVWVHNPGSAAAHVTFYLLERQANPFPATYSDTIPAGDTKRYENAVYTLFGKQTFGALRLTADQPIMVGSRIYSQSGDERDSLGQFFAGVPASFAIGLGQSTELLGVYQTSPSEDSPFRYNFGFVETTGTGTCQAKVTVRDGAGNELGSKTYTVHQWEQAQHQFRDEFPSLSVDNARLTVEVVAGSGRIVAFGSGVANGSQDPSTFEMSFRDDLLAANSAGGTLTGVTAGAGLTGGGTTGAVTIDVGAGTGISVGADSISIADGGVTSAKIADGTIAAADVGFNYAASSSKGGPATDLNCTACVAVDELSGTGASTGQVPTYNGSAVVWSVESGLTLPFEGSAANSGTLVGITNTGSGPAIVGTAQSDSGVYGIGTALPGVRGISTAGSGVEGYSTTGPGLYGHTQTGVAGVQGAGAHNGVYGVTNSSGDSGVFGQNTGGGFGVAGVTTGTGRAVFGSNTNGSGYAGYFEGNVKVTGNLDAAVPLSLTGAPFGSGAVIYGENTKGISSSNQEFGVEGSHTPSGTGGALGAAWRQSLTKTWAAGIRAWQGSGDYAGWFDGKVFIGGDLEVSGTVSKGGGSFVIDHPLDPENKLLYHSFVESPDMKDVYDGVAVLGEGGEAWVELPEWFEALNGDFRYQLTCIGGFAPVFIADEISGNRFRIAGGRPEMKVSWQVTGIRHDPWAQANRIPVEVDKPAEQRGSLLHPDVGQIPGR